MADTSWLDNAPDASWLDNAPDAAPTRKPTSVMGSVGRGMTMAPASAFLDALIPGMQEGATFGERFRRAKAYYDQKNAEAAADNPNAYTLGQGLTGTMAAVATLPIGGGLAPTTTFLSRGLANAAAREGLGLATTKVASSPATAGLMKMLAGTNDAAAANALIAAASTADKSPEEQTRAIQEAAYSPMNALFGGLAPAMEAAPTAARHWRDVSNRARARIMAPGNADAQRANREFFGSVENAGESTRNLGGRDVAAIREPEYRANAVEHARGTAATGKGALTESLSDDGVMVDFNEILAKARADRDRTFGDPATRQHTHPEVLVKGSGLASKAKAADQMIVDLENLYDTRYRPTGTNVEYQGGVQGEFGPTSTTQTYEGQRLQPGTPTEVVGVSREVSNAQATDRPYRQPMAGERVPAGAIRLSGEPRVGDTQLNLSYQRGVGGHPTEPNWSASLTPEQSATYPQTLRPNPEAPVHVNLRHEPYTVTPTSETATQGHLFPTALDAAGEWSATRFPEAPKGTGGTVGGPTATSTNVVRRPISLQGWEDLKTALQKAVNERGAKEYPAGTPENVIKNDALLAYLDRLSGIVKGADEAAIAEQAPGRFEEFMKLKRQQAAAERFIGPARAEQDAAAAGLGEGQGNLAYPSKRGILFWLEKLALAPGRQVQRAAADRLEKIAESGYAPHKGKRTVQAVIAEQMRKERKDAP